MRNKIIALIMIMVCMISGISYNAKAAEETLKFSDVEYSVSVGKTVQTKLYIYNSATGTTYTPEIVSATYKIGDNSVIKVNDKTGVVAGLKNGKTKLEVILVIRDKDGYYKTYTASTIVKVGNGKVEKVPYLRYKKNVIGVGNVIKINVYNKTGKLKKWKSSNKKVAKVKNGKVVALKRGKTVISCVCNGHKLKCTIIVKKNYKKIKKTVMSEDSTLSFKVRKVFFKKNKLMVRITIVNDKPYKIFEIDYAKIRVDGFYKILFKKHIKNKKVSIAPNSKKTIDIVISKNKKNKRKYFLNRDVYHLAVSIRVKFIRYIRR